MTQDYIDLYCERLGPGLWDEPLNAVTNLAFLAAGLLLVIALRHADPAVRRDPPILALVLLLFAVGLGSGLFHTFAVFWAMLADVIPVALFILLYMYLALRRLIGLSLPRTLLGVVLVLALVVAMPALFGFSVATYGVALAAMLGVGGVLHYGRRHGAGAPLLVTAGLFAVSLALRTADLPLCSVLPSGTHFLWHLMNSVVLYSLTRIMMRHGAPGSGSAS